MSAVMKPAEYRELLLGSGNHHEKKLKIDGMQDWQSLTTLDIDPSCKPDVVHDLRVLPLPFGDDTFDEIHAYEVLEHTGNQGDSQFFFAQFSELWRILKPSGRLCVTVPAWDSVWAWGDPGHTRVITHGSLIFLCQSEYTAQVGKTAMTDYRSHYKADFDVLASKYEGDTFGFVLEAVKPSRCTV